MKYHRVDGVLDLSMVGSKKVLFLGLGSLGSLAVANLAYPWRKIVLVDPEILKEENIERHLLGRSDLGKPKAEGVRRWMEVERGLDSKGITTYVGYSQEVLDQHTDADLAIVAIDDRPARDDINAWCVQQDVPALYGTIYPMGTGGHVMVIPTPREVCYLCAEDKMGGEYEGKPEIDYGVNIAELVDDEGNLHAVPALRAAIDSLASDMAILALVFLEGGDVPPQVLVHAQGWEHVANVRPGEELNTLASFISSQDALGMVPHMKLGKLGGRYALSVRRDIIPLKLERWQNCPLHTSQMSVEDI